MSDIEENLDTCGCCESDTEAPEHTNRPGQPSVVYRIGTHSSFLQRMKMSLSGQKILSEDGTTTLYPLAGLTTRSSEDPSIALLDAWSMVGDVITFYQERIANEGFLRTAAERSSVLEMARSIGYELNPGVAASAYLAFTVDDSKDSPREATIKVGTQVMSIPASQDELPQIFETVGDEDFDAYADWNAMEPVTLESQTVTSTTTELYIEGVATNLQQGDGILLVGDTRKTSSSSTQWIFRLIDSVTAYPEDDYTIVTWKIPTGESQADLSSETNLKLYAFRQRAKLFGYNAPDPKTLSDDVLANYGITDPLTQDWASVTLTAITYNLDLDTTYPKIRPDSWIVIVEPDSYDLYKVEEPSTNSRTGFTLTSQVTTLHMDKSKTLAFSDRRDNLVYVQTEELTLAKKPVTTAVTGTAVTLDGSIDGLTKDQTLIVTGKLDEDDTDTVSQVVTVVSATTGSETTALVLKGTGITSSLAPSTVSIYGNVVAATHGETISGEVLGNGDGAKTNQEFTLKKSPLTYVSAATPSGGESTLEIRVNGVLWEEATSLYGKEATDRIYISRINDDADTTITFGDGVSGARLPTGQENIKATYRNGIGNDGEVGAGSLTLLKKRPFGVKEVTNPIAASGAADPEKLENARTNAPLTVLTLDRIVSLQDFEDYARAYKGIGKAQAINLWDGKTNLVHITIADDKGQTVDETTTTYSNLVDAIDAARDPTADVRIDSIDALTFDVTATVYYDEDYESDDVKADIEELLEESFAFDEMDFAQPVTPAEIISVIHQVKGVVAVDLDAPSTVLVAEIARCEDGDILPAQLYTINSSGITLTMTPAD